jgi:glycosyltransferase involved in cell wall biosynthesis
MEKLPISVTIITLNEEIALPDCLASVAFAQDIIIVDSGSTDNTVKIAENYGARVIQQPWMGYGQQKNYAVDQARFDWVLCLDADERVDETLADSIRQAMLDPGFEGYRMARKNHFLGRWLTHGFGYPDIKTRLMHRHHGRWSEPPVHELIEIDGSVGLLKGDLLHLSGEDLYQYLEKQNRYTSLQVPKIKTTSLYKIAFKIIFNPLFAFFKGYFIKRAFLDGIPGLVHTSIHCFNTFSKYAKLYDQQIKNRTTLKNR